MREVPDFIVDRCAKQILMVDKSLEFGSLRDRFPKLRQFLKEYLSNMEIGFVSPNNKDFVDQLEHLVGKCQFMTNFAIRVRPDGYRLFIKGKEKFD